MLKQATDYSNIYLFMTRSNKVHLHLGLLKPSLNSHIVAELENNFFVLLPTLNHYITVSFDDTEAVYIIWSFKVILMGIVGLQYLYMSYLGDCLYVLPHNYSTLVKSPHLQRIYNSRIFFLMQKPYFKLLQGKKKADKIKERADGLICNGAS